MRPWSWRLYGSGVQRNFVSGRNLNTYIHEFLPKYIHTDRHTCIHTYMQAGRQTYIHTFIHEYIPHSTLNPSPTPSD